jgi:hypothetical protein
MKQSNWFTPEEMKDVICLNGIMTGSEIAAVCLVGYGERCAAWRWRECPACEGAGNLSGWDNETGKPIECDNCKGTGTDGTGVGRCGLGR